MDTFPPAFPVYFCSFLSCHLSLSFSCIPLHQFCCLQPDLTIRNFSTSNPFDQHISELFKISQFASFERETNHYVFLSVLF